jgi:Thaumatin family
MSYQISRRRSIYLVPCLFAFACARTALEVDTTSSDTTSSIGTNDTCSNVDPQNAPLDFSFQVKFQNRCDQTIWPGFGRVDGLDQSVAAPELWSPIEPGADHAVTVQSIVFAGIALWPRTGCVFDAQGVGHCQTGDCGGAICPTVVNQLPLDATLYGFEYGYESGFNLPMSIDSACCGVRSCSSDLNDCPSGSRVQGAAGVVACKAFCPDGGACCHTYSNGCYGGGDVVVTFCP